MEIEEEGEDEDIGENKIKSDKEEKSLNEAMMTKETKSLKGRISGKEEEKTFNKREVLDLLSPINIKKIKKRIFLAKIREKRIQMDILHQLDEREEFEINEAIQLKIIEQEKLYKDINLKAQEYKFKPINFNLAKIEKGMNVRQVSSQSILKTDNNIRNIMSTYVESRFEFKGKEKYGNSIKSKKVINKRLF